MPARRSPAHADDLAWRSRLSTMQMGIWPSLFTGFFVAAYYVLTWDEPHRTVLVALCGAAFVVSALMLFCAPLEAIVRSRWHELFFLGWSGSLIALIATGVALDGGVTSPVSLVFFLPLAYAALVYPIRTMVLVLVLDLAAFLALAAFGPDAPAAYVWIFACSLLATGWMCAWQSRHLDAQRCELSHMSRTDPLTGCLNRRGFEERMEAELADAQRHVRPLSLVVLDLDDFKQVNDTQGHNAGDALLRWVVSRVTENVRPRDALGRLGGDEFALVLDRDRASAERMVERLCAVLSARTEASVGLAVYPEDGMDADALHQAADQELYARKHARPGRADGPRRELSWAAALATAVDDRMAVQHSHSCAVADYAGAIAQRLRWPLEQIALMRLAAMLHDVGKIRLPEEILRKPGPLTREEFAVVARHPEIGAELVARVEGLQEIVDWIRYSHERVDGHGYPGHLTGDAIPMPSRVLLVADAFDAMTSDRPYRPRMTPEEAMEELRAHAGTQFDPDCVDMLEVELLERGVLAEVRGRV